MGHGYAGPTYHALRVGLLRDAKLQVSLIVDKFRSTWATTGCNLMRDGWKDTRQRPLVNFLVYSPEGITFLKSVDISHIYGSAEILCNLFADVVSMIGPENVVHLVTDSAPNYKAAGRLHSEKFPTIAWSPCAANCINLILEDVGKLLMVHDLVKRMSKETIFVYNHKWPLSFFLRKIPVWTEIICLAETHFAKSFIALQNLYQHKDDLQALFTSTDPEFKKLLKASKIMEVKSIVLDERAWNNCLIIVKIMSPIIRLLHICDADEKPSLPYVYEGMHRARLGIKKMFDKKPLYKPYTEIIDKRWDCMLRRDLHAAAYYLNPSFIYNEDSFYNKPKIMGGLMTIFEKQNESSKTKLFPELKIYREREGSFSRDMTLTCSKTSQPKFWIVEEEEPSELDYNELENALAEEYPKDDEVTNQENLDDFDEDFTMPPEENELKDDRKNQN